MFGHAGSCRFLSKALATLAAGASVAVLGVRVPLAGPPYKRTGTAAGPRKRPEQRRPLVFSYLKIDEMGIQSAWRTHAPATTSQGLRAPGLAPHRQPRTAPAHRGAGPSCRRPARPPARPGRQHGRRAGEGPCRTGREAAAPFPAGTAGRRCSPAAPGDPILRGRSARSAAASRGTHVGAPQGLFAKPRLVGRTMNIAHAAC